MSPLLSLIFLASAAAAATDDYVIHPSSSPPNDLYDDEELWLNPYLPDTLYPVHYDLWMFPDFYFDGSTYSGSVSISLDVLNDTSEIILHIKTMNITRVILEDVNGIYLWLRAAFNYEPNQYLVVLTMDPLTKGSVVTLILDFESSLVNGIVGYYKSTYINDFTGEMSWLATTKFQPSDARKAFPNFDEPRFKSTFNITLRHWSNFTALANMPPKAIVDIDDVWRETNFETTPSMSSYLVCFIVCDFAFKNNSLLNGIEHRIWARPDRIDQTDYALWAGPIIQDFFVEEFGVPYPLPKLDQFAVPDYPSGATEHWGLITYRDTRLLYDPSQVGDYDKQRTLSLISHELSHNHVGDLVTCASWDEIWLNEGFATYYTVKGVVAADPTMYYDGQFFSRTVQSVMITDAANSSRPMITEITNPDEANAVFDSISYDKGAALLSMIESFLGQDTFRLGISRYLKDNAFGSVVSDDLWKGLQAEAGPGLNIKEIMAAWIYSMGYPVIEISVLPGNQLSATQKRFLTDPSTNPDSPPSEYGYKWYVPLNYRTQGGQTGLIWMNLTDVTFDSPLQSDTEWIKFNYDHSGFYRVNYPVEMWSLIHQQLLTDFTVFTDVERSNLLSDGMNLARAEQLSYSTALDLIEYIGNDEDLLPWDTARGSFDYLFSMIVATEDYPLWRSYMLQLTSDLMDIFRIADDGTHVQKLTRSNIMRLSCLQANYTDCVQNTTILFKAWIEDEVLNPIPLDIRRYIYAIGMEKSGIESDWDTAWDRYTVVTSGQEQDNILYALSRSTDLPLIDRLLQYSMDPSKIRSQDFFTTISYVSSSYVANYYLWQWVQDNYEDLVNRFGLDNRSLGRMVPEIVSRFNTESQLQEVLEFFDLYPDSGTGQRFREEALQTIRANIRWMSSCLPDVINWLNDHVTP